MSTRAHAHSFAEWRDTARGLLRQRIAPYEVQWQAQGANDDLFGYEDGIAPAPPPAPAAIKGRGRQLAPGALQITRDLLAMFETAASCRQPDRWAFLYRVLWRWNAGERAVLAPADADGMRLHAMIRAVNLEAHRIIDGLRFLARPPQAGAPRLVAWCTPAHDVLPRVAAHFARRMAADSWLIATPQGTAAWDGRELRFSTAGVARPADLEERIPALCRDDRRLIRVLPQEKEQVAAQIAAQAGPVTIEFMRREPGRAPSLPLAECRRCELWRHATQAVPGLGPQQARIMLVGDQPGDVDDIAGKPFTGPAGRLLNTVLQQAGLERGAVYLTHAVKHFKSEARGRRRLQKPLARHETGACSAWLEHELQLVAPRVVVALGEDALRALLKSDEIRFDGLLNQAIADGGRWVVAIHHPATVQKMFRQEDRERAAAAMAQGLRLAQRLADREAPPQAPLPQEQRLFA